MKLAEALQERADLNRRIGDLNRRLEAGAMVQEGEKPNEEPEELLAELERCAARLEELIAAINMRNCAAQVDGTTLTELLARRDAMTLQLRVYRDFLVAASQVTHRARGTEIKIHPTVDVVAVQKRVDRMSADLRRLDNLIQQTNWTVEL